MSVLLTFKAEGNLFLSYLDNLRDLLDGKELPEKAYGKLQQKVPKNYRTMYRFLLQGKIRKIGENYVFFIAPAIPKVYLLPSTTFCFLFLLTGSPVLFFLTFAFLLPEIFYTEIFYSILLRFMAKKRMGMIRYITYREAIIEVLDGTA